VKTKFQQTVIIWCIKNHIKYCIRSGILLLAHGRDFVVQCTRFMIGRVYSFHFSSVLYVYLICTYKWKSDFSFICLRIFTSVRLFLSILDLIHPFSDIYFSSRLLDPRSHYSTAPISTAIREQMKIFAREISTFDCWIASSVFLFRNQQKRNVYDLFLAHNITRFRKGEVDA